MLSQQDRDFLRYWEVNRLRKKRFLRQFSIGLPFGVLIAVVIFLNVVSGWYEKAEMEVRSNSSIILVIIIALTCISVFVTIFWSKHAWEQNEQRYMELKSKEEKENDNATNADNKQSI
jgi:ATP/ADP translocase